MATVTTNLGVTKLFTGQEAKEDTINVGSDLFDAAIAGLNSKNLGGATTAQTLSATEARKFGHVFTNAGAAIDVKFPLAYSARDLLIKNSSGFTLTIKTDAVGSTGVDIPTGKIRAVWINGNNVEAQSPESDAGSGGITNSAGANVIPKSDGTNLVASTISDTGPSAVGGVVIAKSTTLNDILDRALKVTLTKTGAGSGGTAVEVRMIADGAAAGDVDILKILGQAINGGSFVHCQGLVLAGATGTVNANIPLRISPNNNGVVDSFGILIDPIGERCDTGTVSVSIDGFQDAYRDGGLAMQAPILFTTDHQDNDDSIALAHGTGQPNSHLYIAGLRDGSLYLRNDAAQTYDPLWTRRKGDWAKIRSSELVNEQTGTTYTVSDEDFGQLVALTNAGTKAITLPQAGLLNGSVSDNFNRADGALGANWIALGTDTAAEIISNQFGHASSASALWNASFLANCKVTATVPGSLPSRAWIYLRTKVVSGSPFWYRAGYDTDGLYVIAKQSGVLAASATAAVIGDVVEFSASGGSGPCTLILKVNGSVVLTHTDSTSVNTASEDVVTLRVGLGGTANGANNKFWDDFSAYGLAANGQSFIEGWFCDFVNEGAGTATITPTTSTIGGAASKSLPQNSWCRVVSDGANYRIAFAGNVAGVTLAGAETLTNKRIQNRVDAQASTATLVPEVDTYNVFRRTAQAAAIAINNHSTSTPADNEAIEISILDDGTPRAISWGSNYVARGGIALPATTTANKLMTMGFKWYSHLSKFVLLALAQES